MQDQEMQEYGISLRQCPIGTVGRGNGSVSRTVPRRGSCVTAGLSPEEPTTSHHLVAYGSSDKGNVKKKRKEAQRLYKSEKRLQLGRYNMLCHIKNREKHSD